MSATSFVQRFKHAVGSEDVDEMSRLYHDFPQIHPQMTTMGRNNVQMTPIDYVLSWYITGREGQEGMDPDRLAIIMKVIEHSSHEELNALDGGNDSIMSRVFFCTDQRVLHKIMVKCARHGYVFDRKPTIDLYLYLQSMSEDRVAPYMPTVDFIIDHMDNNILSDYIVLHSLARQVVCLGFKDFRHIIEKLTKRGISISDWYSLIGHMVSRCTNVDEDDVRRKIDMMVDELGMQVETFTLVNACTRPISPQLLEYIIHRMLPSKPSQSVMNQALLQVVRRCHTSQEVAENDKDVIKILCGMGANVGYHETGDDWRNSPLGIAFMMHHVELVNLLLSFAPTRLLHQMERRRTIQSQVKSMIKEHIGFRDLMRRATTTTRKRTLAQKIVSSLPDDMRLQLESLMIPPRSKSKSIR